MEINELSSFSYNQFSQSSDLPSWINGTYDNKTHSFGFKSSQKYVGYLLGQKLSASVIEIHYISILKKYRSQGLGAKFLGLVLDEMKKQNFLEVWLEVRESNQMALKLYESFDFIKTGQRKNYYSNGESSINMNLKWAA